MREFSGPVHTPASLSQASLDVVSVGTHPGGQAQGRALSYQATPCVVRLQGLQG